MAAGIPLTDADRQGWLMALAQRIGEARRSGSGLVVACSALKRSYRDLLRAGGADVQFVHLTGRHSLLAERLARRQGHFMPPSMLDSQLATLEVPAPEESAWEYDVAAPPEAIVGAIVDRANAGTPPRHLP
jgi:gluconokinase